MKDPKSKARHSTAPEAAAAAKPKNPKADKQDKDNGNPPFTTKWGITSPKFGAAGSGGLEDSPGPEAD